MKRMIVLSSLLLSSAAFADIPPPGGRVSTVDLSGAEAKSLYFSLAKGIEKEAVAGRVYTKEFKTADKSVSISCTANKTSLPGQGRADLIDKVTGPNPFSYDCSVSVAK